jgi:DNA-binding NarL/FixJ family response regulator
VRISDELLSEKELRETEFYRGWMRDRGWLHASSIVVQVTEAYRAYIFAMRPPGHPFTVRERLILNDLAPDLAVAAQIGKDLADQRDTINRLRSSAREFDILRAQGLKHDDCLIALALFQGQHIKEIAAKSNRSHDSVKWHVKAIYKTLGVRNRAEFMHRLNDLFRQ